MLVERRRQLTARAPRAFMCSSCNRTSATLARRLIEWPERSQPVAVAAEQVGEPVGIVDVGTSSRGLPSGRATWEALA